MVEHIDFLPLLLGEAVRGIDSITAYYHTYDGKDKGIQPYLPDSGTWYYIVFFLIGIVGYFCVPTVAGWIIEAGGGIGSYGRNVNQTAQRGAQGAYTGGKAAMAGAGAAVGNVGGRIKGALLKGK